MARAFVTRRLGSACALVLAASLPVAAQTIRKVGEERPYELKSPADYPPGDAFRAATWSEKIVSPGAAFLRVHFEQLALPSGDYLTISSPDGSDFWTYTDKGPLGTGEFWSFSVEGDTAILELHSGPVTRSSDRDVSYGFSVDRIAYGFESLEPPDEPGAKIVCGTDGRRDAACYSSVGTDRIARLSFQKSGSSYVCTGWLVAGSNSSTMLTNNHCFTNQTVVNTVQARFNYQRTSCGGSTTATTSTYAGGTFLRTNSSLDYTLFTLKNNPEATWGEYTATSKAPSVGLTINFPQHPGGGLKRVGYWEDSAASVRCKINATNQSYGYASGSQVGYGCDSEGGSSGSPILDAGTGRVIALHHLGGVSSSPCLNGGTVMSRVCTSAGSLLSCASN